jgi:hypothetical protein
MKDAKGHGSNPRGVHSSGISTLPTVKQMHLSAGDAAAKVAGALEKRINEIVKREAEALGGWSKTGPLISGIVSDKFPEHVKSQLRLLHNQMNTHGDKAFASYRAARLRLHTARSRYGKNKAG